MTNPKLLILDEPTSVLTPQAVQTLFVTLRKLAAEGCSILYISHKLDEIRALCHHCTVLRGGKVTGEVDPTQGDQRQPVAPDDRRRAAAAAAPRGARRRGGARGPRRSRCPRKTRSAPASRRSPSRCAPARCVGIAGVSGNGQQELMRALSGEDVRAPAGSIRLFDQDIARDAPRRRRRGGLHFVPEERLGRGAVPTLSLAQNTLLTRTRAVGRGGLAAHRRRRRARRGADPPLLRPRRRPGLGGQEPLGRQPAEVHRRPRDRRRSRSC